MRPLFAWTGKRPSHWAERLAGTVHPPAFTESPDPSGTIALSPCPQRFEEYEPIFGVRETVHVPGESIHTPYTSLPRRGGKPQYR
jgi:hypothetical protein